MKTHFKLTRNDDEVLMNEEEETNEDFTAVCDRYKEVMQDYGSSYTVESKIVSDTECIFRAVHEENKEVLATGKLIVIE